MDNNKAFLLFKIIHDGSNNLVLTTPLYTNTAPIVNSASANNYHVVVNGVNLLNISNIYWLMLLLHL